MKQIDYYIESNKKILEDLINKFEETEPGQQVLLQKIKNDIDKVEHYIKGLEDAKKYILEESE